MVRATIARAITECDTTDRENDMPKYLLHANYIGDGVKGLLKEGGSSRKAAAEKAVQSLGGTVEAFYYAFGDTDVYALLDLPDNASMAGAALAINATGLVATKTTVLLTPAEVDAATKKTASYRAPGQ